MAEPPSAKRIRRSELDSPGSSRSSSPDAHASHAAQARLAAYFSQNFAESESPDSQDTKGALHRVTETIDPPQSQEEHADDGAYSFRLFAKPSGQLPNESTVQPAKVVIRSPSPLNAEPGLIKSRSKDYYLARPWTSREHEQAACIIQTSEQLFAEAAHRWAGCELPWRVQTIRVSKKQAAALAGHTSVSVVGTSVPEGSSGRRRLNRKRRIVLRKRAQAKLDKAAKHQRDQEEKEAAEREKRTRRNREKKVKKKQKEKAKKEAEGQDAAENSA